MISFDALPGNEAVKQSLRRALADRFPQTVLLCGDDSAGLAALAEVLAAAILCESEGERPCGVCTSCRKCEAHVHPDLTVIDEGENELKVDLARRIKAENAIIPNDGARRVTIIHHAHQLNGPAQNALLKELEEPPAFAFFILTSEQPDTLLPTVRSRCLRFSLEPPHGAPTAADDETNALLAPYLMAIADRREDRMMQAALALEKTPRRQLSGVFATLQAAIRDAILQANGLRPDLLAPALAQQSAALARAVPSARLLRLYELSAVLAGRAERNAAAAAMTNALTSDVYRVCFLADTSIPEF